MLEKKNRRTSVLPEDALAWSIRRYDNGNGPSIRLLARACHVSYTTLHTAFRRAGVRMRRKGTHAPEGVK